MVSRNPQLLLKDGNTRFTTVLLKLINYELNIHVFVSLNYTCSQETMERFSKINTFLCQLNDGIFYIFEQIEVSRPGIFVNRTLPSFHGGSLKITLTVPLNRYVYIKTHLDNDWSYFFDLLETPEHSCFLLFIALN